MKNWDLGELTLLFLTAILVAALGFGGFKIYDELTRDPHEGTVVIKHYEQEETTYIWQKIGDTGHLVPVTDDEDWVVMVDDGTDKNKRIELPEKQWENVEIGDYIKEDK